MDNTLADQRIEEITHGGLKSFYELYQNYKGLVRGLLFRLTPAHQLDDLTQEAFVKIWKGLNFFKGNSSLKVWIYKVTYHVAIDALRKKKDLFSTLKESLIDHSVNFESRLSDQECVRKILNEFSADDREVLVLFFLEELSLQEISEIIDIPIGTVKSRLYYAKQKMKDALKKEGIKL